MKDPYPFQVVGSQFMARHKDQRCINGDEPGMGKTLQSIEAVKLIWQAEKVLVVTLKPVKPSWQEKIAEQDGRACHVVMGNNSFDQDRSWGQALKSKATYIIVHWEFVRRRWETIVDWEPEVIIYDESHKIKNRMAAVSQVCQKISTRLPDTWMFLLTGTPIWNKPIDLWNQLYIASKRQIGPYWPWCRKWLTVEDVRVGRGRTVTKVTTPKDPEAFREHVRPWLIRREKKDVMSELPPINYELVFLDMEKEQKLAYTTMFAQNYAKVNGFEYGVQNVPVKILRLKQISTSPYLLDKSSVQLDGAKLEWFKELLEVLDGKKLLVFSQYAEVVDRLALHIPKAAIITGKVSEKERNQRVHDFIHGDTQILCMTLGTGGIGLDGLQTVCSYMVLMDWDWTPANNKQAIGRIGERIGQTEPVTVYIPMLKGSIEFWVYERVGKKEEIAEMSIPIETVYEYFEGTAPLPRY